MVADQRIHLPLALSAKAKKDFELTVDVAAPRDHRQGAHALHPREAAWFPLPAGAVLSGACAMITSTRRRRRRRRRLAPRRDQPLTR